MWAEIQCLDLSGPQHLLELSQLTFLVAFNTKIAENDSKLNGLSRGLDSVNMWQVKELIIVVVLCITRSPYISEFTSVWLYASTIADLLDTIYTYVYLNVVTFSEIALHLEMWGCACVEIPAEIPGERAMEIPGERVMEIPGEPAMEIPGFIPILVYPEHVYSIVKRFPFEMSSFSPRALATRVKIAASCRGQPQSYRGGHNSADRYRAMHDVRDVTQYTSIV